nr:MAG TPA: hypothetical protein [Caudoviricetes sp.]
MLLSLFHLSTYLSTTHHSYTQTYPQVKNLINHTNRLNRQIRHLTTIPYNPITPSHTHTHNPTYPKPLTPTSDSNNSRLRHSSTKLI